MLKLQPTKHLSYECPEAILRGNKPAVKSVKGIRTAD